MGILLDNAMFDDGSVECKNFKVSTWNDSFICEWDYIKSKFSSDIQKQIFQAMHLGKRYIVVYKSESVAQEISWD